MLMYNKDTGTYVSKKCNQKKQFYEYFLGMLISSLNNDFKDNYDYFRFGKKKEGWIRKKVLKFLHSKKFIKLNFHRIIGYKNQEQVWESLDLFKKTFDLLADEESKDIFIKLLLYRLLGYKKVKLIDTENLWNLYKNSYSYADKNDFIKIKLNSWKLYKCDLSNLGYPIQLYSMPWGMMMQYCLKMYEYKTTDSKWIKAENDDIVLDCGGCFGETALYFAYNLSQNGHVYSFEFVPGNIEIFKKNMKLNEKIAEKIELVPHPVWSESGKIFYYKDKGPGTFINDVKFESYEGEVISITIDDFIREKMPGRIGFIKMDIEGAELSALKGAEKTIREYKPRLAISVYHRDDDLIVIPSFIENLGLNYKLYLEHYTAHNEETVLYAIAD